MTSEEKRNRIWALEDIFFPKWMDLEGKAKRAKSTKHKYLLARKGDKYFTAYRRCLALWRAILDRERGWTKPYISLHEYRERIKKKEEGKSNYHNQLKQKIWQNYRVLKN